MIKGLSLVGVIFLFITSTELLITHQRAASHNPQANTVLKSIPPIIQKHVFREDNANVVLKLNSHKSHDEMISELKLWLSDLELGFLFESLVSLGVFHKNDLKFLDSRDRRRLLLETSLHAASIGQSASIAVESWEGILKSAGEWHPVIIPKKVLVYKPVEPKIESKLSLSSSSSPSSSSSSDHVLKDFPKVNCKHPKKQVSESRRSSVGFENIAVYINSSPDGRRYFGENFQRNYYANRVIPGIKTWGVNFPHLWVVLEESVESLKLVEACPVSSPGNVKEYNCDGKPILLSPCDNGYWGESGPCCKAEFAFRHLLFERQDVLPLIKWFLFTDDDTYFVPHSLLRFLTGYNASEPIVVSRGESPLFLTYGRLHTGSVNKQGFTCTNPNVKIGMLQPAIFSVSALQKMGPAIVTGQALTRTCASFGITHDNALGILSWMHGLHFYVKGSHGSLHQEMAGAFNVTQCEEKGVSKCFEQGFQARVDALRHTPGKFVLHGVKMPHQFRSLHALYQEPAMSRCIGEDAAYVFSEAQQPPLKALQGYEFTKHALAHLPTIEHWASHGVSTDSSLLSTGEWPVLQPRDCVGDEEMADTPWDVHVGHMKTSKFSPDRPSHVYL